ncbi:UDP-2,4-diacetamido-2,4,6-trideoxy-beta-L-altropyranose hydrolase [Phormidium yuhuli AB48]|uniref:UDP-2,4-diacetamido-2,4, 6-trideoxy-beta-L-altropyranose hydrolase n=1 Tax=Phormidium yuhuli AB48 TaxID=2940671 RepID=A0ABY5AL47_9CYAN|nr:UDP-2,4-diacetamido-2,4,6-trideoxy-beta-L-altropyranose hydrolase [Phormidium yuhuli]USR89925.1 UDP-2,4-diacetamido-2,4,6-trideoxy-beta-L-altropyranose hydrolase [Phormidium yuhuli AB48]
MKVIFRVDSSAQIGSGHLIRCRTLAEELRRRGAEVRFICREHRGNLIHLLSQAAFPVTVLPPPPESSGEMREDYQAWLGVSGETDAQETLLALGGESADWLVVDHYGLDAVWERQLRPQVKQILVIDDLANRPHDCDVLLDQNYSQLGERRYQGLVPHSCRLLLGPRYGLLRPEYQLYRQTRSPHRGQVRRVLVFFGGTDSQNMTGKALEALSSSEFEGISVDVVVGANNPHRGELEQLVEARHSAGIGETRLYSTRPHLADLMAQADLALGAGGTTTWERCCLGLPTVVVSIAENQVAACEALQAEGVIQYLGAASHINVTQLRTVLCEWLGQPSQLQDMSVQGQLHVDGLGTQRVAECLKPTALEQLTLRLARVEDMALYYDWVNEPDVRRQSWNQEPIGWNSHQTWFQGKMADPNCYLGVLEADGLPVGQIRFDIQGEDAVIDYSLDRLVRGRGWATPLVRLGLKLLNNVKPTYLYAEVKPENRPSAAVFLRLGFQEESSPPLLQRTGFQNRRVFRLPFSQMRMAGSMIVSPNSS